jgi:tetratricopeptide (TPR) repeat protein
MKKLSASACGAATSTSVTTPRSKLSTSYISAPEHRQNFAWYLKLSWHGSISYAAFTARELMDVKLRDETRYLPLVEEGADLFGAGEYEAALDVFWKAFRLRPGAPVVLFNIGRTMEELNDPRCEDFYAAAGAQGNVDAFYQLATLCIPSDRTEEAVEHLRAYLKGNPANDSCTKWARNTIRQLCPSPLLVWRRKETCMTKKQEGCNED